MRGRKQEKEGRDERKKKEEGKERREVSKEGRKKERKKEETVSIGGAGLPVRSGRGRQWWAGPEVGGAGSGRGHTLGGGSGEA